METIIVEHLTHAFGERRALEDLSFTVGEGEVFALLGPNGAGKTTTVRLLNGLYRATAGSVRVLGLEPATQGEQVRAQTGVLTESPALYERLTARQNLRFFGEMAGMPAGELRRRMEELLEFFDLAERADERVATFSKGMKQRLALARALLNRPKILFLDEPTAGLDPEASRQVRELIASLRRENGQTVFLCTHILTEAERLCDRVLILHQGRALAVGSLAELQQRFNPGVWVEVQLLEPRAIAPGDLTPALQVQAQDALLRVQVSRLEDIPTLIHRLAGLGTPILRVEPLRPSLEEIYFKLQDQAEGGQP
ncbi:ABC transporter ATP-binding protein [Anaerolinea thermophila]|uniref:ABC transporter ATP-binding protein n=1 Tax=Anaerolinea thermophila (strain DSM 14523 / JCM 11388 / NBRC 100420 / UNI-1) TaxID=926569 RepID=E8MYA0_ANATU|nr:ABC transporter ATP-binding protein [Anaerolinea thermophila]BAJ62045.1 putative ABC transporter ATP-binding protein [Anaerolinea thermophila UNI-1]